MPTKYDIERNGTVVAENVNETKYKDTGLTADTEYTYRVRAKNEVGTSAWTAPFKKKTKAVDPQE